ncbi:uncharacterized protein LOC115750694 [Rhodamnia argentea]|uniref:Uncharacterized protein LOC115750694 n=1 Tax=Rhodamnia argentea TaxID=178133 RepID=A0A8B8QD23_9MYRT|nr:uncharacterized protein LOC115750694 [Rhodamnia argentea]
MASALALSLNPPLLSNNSLPLLSSLPPSPSLHSQLSPALASSQKRRVLKPQKGIPGASAEGVPSKLVEDSKFVPLNAEDPRYGPPALLLVGFDAEEAGKIQQLLKEMDGEFLQIVYCTENMVSRSLWEAVHTRQPDFKAIKIAKNVLRICFLSGLSGEEMMMFIDAFPETGLEPAVFAALVPNSANKPVQELIEEIMGDHEMLTGKQ